jgi:hypothetical protein
VPLKNLVHASNNDVQLGITVKRELKRDTDYIVRIGNVPHPPIMVSDLLFAVLLGTTEGIFIG